MNRKCYVILQCEKGKAGEPVPIRGDIWIQCRDNTFKASVSVGRKSNERYRFIDNLLLH